MYDFIATQALGAAAPLCMGVGSGVGQNHPGCQGVEPPGTSLPRSYPISLGQMRKHLRGPGQATYDFDGGQPGLLRVSR